MKGFSATFFLTVSFAVLGAGVARAQGVDSVATHRTALDSVLAVRHIAVAPIEIFGAQTPLEIAVHPIEVTSLPVAELTARSQPTTIADAMRSFSSSLDIRRYGTLGALAFPSFRGLPSEYTILYRDGVRLSNEQNSLIDLGKLSFQGVQKIELLPASSSILLGGDAIGAALNIITQLPKDHTEITAKSVTTSYDDIRSITEKSEFFSVSAPVTPALGVALIGSLQNSNGRFPFRQFEKYDVIRTNNDARFSTFDGVVRYALSDLSSLVLYGNYLYSERGAPGAATIDRKGSSSPARQLDQDYEITSRYYSTLSDRTSLLLNASYQSQYETYNDSSVIVDNDHPLADHYRNELIDLKANVQHTFSEQFGLYTGLTLGRDYLTGNEDVTPTGDSVITRSHASLFVAMSYDPLQTLNITASTRLESYERVDAWRSRLLPQLSVSWELIDHLLMNGALARTYHAPTLNDLYWITLGDPNLLDESGTNAQLGLKLQPLSIGGLLFDASVTGFSATIKNEILWVPATNNFYRPLNVRDVTSQGVEGAVHATVPLSNATIVEASLSSTYLRSINRSHDAAVPDREVPFSSPMQNLATVTFEQKNIGRLDALAHYRGHKYTDLGNTEISKLPPVTTFDLLLSPNSIVVSNQIDLTLQLGLLNVTNVTYEEQPNYPLPGRTIRLTVEANFHSQNQ